MAGPSISTAAFILQKAPLKEAFQPLTAFSAEYGTLRILHRIPRQPSPTHVPLDYFDRVALLLDAGSSGTWFVKEARLLERHPGIGEKYARLTHASAFVSLISRNPVHEESRASVNHLIGTALAAFASTDRPDIVGIKSLYCFSRDEGYPLKQQWFPTLSREDRDHVISLLNRPLADQTLAPEIVAQLHRKMEDYLKGHTDILID